VCSAPWHLNPNKKVKLTKGDVNKTTEAFDVFDRYQPGKKYKVPPYHH
jgi:hypothetical protein